MASTNYEAVVKANIAVHTKLAAFYEKTEPHFRDENVAIVRARLKAALESTNGSSVLDLGCGTGFMISIAKTLAKRVVGVDVTRAMLDRVDVSGTANIELHEHDTGSFPVEPGTFDVVTAYSFLHHLYDIVPTLRTAATALKPGGQFYVDLDPNFYFWEVINDLDRLERDAPKKDYDPIVRREIDAVAHKDEEIARDYGIAADTFNDAEYGKTSTGGFKEEVLREQLLAAGFSKVTFRYYWFLGQAALINADEGSKEDRLRSAKTTDELLQRLMPLSRHLYKYVGFIATK